MKKITDFKGKILVLDEYPFFTFISGVIPNNGYETLYCSTTGDVRRTLAEFPSAILMVEPSKLLGDGVGNFIGMIKNEYPQVDFIVCSGHGTFEEASEAIKAGAFDYKAKPIDVSEILKTLSEIEINRTVSFNYQTWRTVSQDCPPDEVLFAGLEDDRLRIMRAAKTKSPILLQGESGTGKTTIARAIHNLSDRSKKPFVTVTCGTLPETLVESELFGNVRGAFTGAVPRDGLFKAAEGGTIFFDEIGDLSFTTQHKLLGVLNDNTFRALGGKEDISVDVRVISATNMDLAEMVSNGKFREDLYYRINMLSFYVPPLRARKHIIPALLKVLIKEQKEDLKKEIELLPGAEAKILSYDWKRNNIRELKNVVTRAAIFSDTGKLSAEDFNFHSKAIAKKHTLPKILIIDDQYGSDDEEGKDFREELCAQCGFVEITPEEIDKEIEVDQSDDLNAAAVFCSSQEKTASFVRNAPEIAQNMIQAGWPSKEGWRWSLIFLDMQFVSGSILPDRRIAGTDGDDDFGLTLLSAMVDKYPDPDKAAGNTELPVVVLSGISGNLQKRLSALALKISAKQFVEKNVLIENKEVARRQISELLNDWGLIEDDSGLLAGRNLSLLKTLREARQLCKPAANILIEGDPGTGKRALALYMHQHSPRKFNKFIEPSGEAGLAEQSTLTPYTTVSVDQLNGKTFFIRDIDMRDASTLSNIYDLALKNHYDLMIVSVSVNPGRQEDSQLDRMKNAFSFVSLLPLFKRSEDVELIFRRYIKEICEESLQDDICDKKVDPSAGLLLRKYRWPGNLPQLREAAKYVANDSRNQATILPRHLPLYILNAGDKKTAIPEIANDSLSDVTPQAEESLITRTEEDKSLAPTIEDFIAIINRVVIPADREKLAGLMKTIDESNTYLLRLLIGAALKATQDNTGRYIYSQAMFKLLDIVRSKKDANFKELPKEQQEEITDRIKKENSKNTMMVKRMLIRILDTAKPSQALLASIVKEYEEHCRSNLHE